VATGQTACLFKTAQHAKVWFAQKLANMNSSDPLDTPCAAPRVTEAVVSGGPTEYDLVRW
jgi:hypothetical protein